MGFNDIFTTRTVIFTIYKKTFSGVLYSPSFGLSLVVLCMICTFIIMAVTSNVVLSLGMVGALSIVRFRTAVKDPLDIVFLFWSLAAGIVLAAGMAVFAIVGSIIIGIVILAFANRKVKETPYILMVSTDMAQKEADIMQQIELKTVRHILKSKSVTESSMELTVEVVLRDKNSDFINALAAIGGVKAGTKGSDFDGLTSFQTDEERTAQEEALLAILNTQIPDTTDLEFKYPVVYSTSIKTEMEQNIQAAILQDFEHWNQGYDSWAVWADSYYASDMQHHTDREDMTLAQYKEAIRNVAQSTEVTSLYFDNMLIRGEWADIHYRVIAQDMETREMTVEDVMQFLHFEEDGDGVKVIECWTK